MFIFLTIFQIAFHNLNLQSTKHHKLSPVNEKTKEKKYIHKH